MKEPPDASTRMNEARELASRGLHEEALNSYLWCFDRGHLEDPSFAAVRLSFLLGYMAKLGQSYPPALRALEQRRDVAESRVLGGENNEWIIREFGALNRELSDSTRTLRVFDMLVTHEGRAAAAKSLLLFVLPLLVKARRYDEVVNVAGDVSSLVNAEIERLETQLEFIRGRPEKWAYVRLADDLKQSVMEEGADYYEALLGSGRSEDASWCADQLLAVHSTGRSFATMIRRAVRAGSVTAARSLADRGLEVLTLEERADLVEAIEQIPRQPE